MDPLAPTVIRPAGPPLICDQGDGTWQLDLDDRATVILTTAQVRRLVDDYLAQSLGGPFEVPL